LKRRLAALAAMAAGGCAVTSPVAGPDRTASTSPTPVTAAPVVAAPAPAGTARLLAEARRFVFRVRNVECLATGTAFAFDGAVVTNRHVAAGASTLSLATWAGDDFAATVAGHDGPADLARLAAVVPAGTVAPVAAAAGPAVGDAVYVTGYPEGDQLSVAAGTVIGVDTSGDLGVTGPVLEISDRVEPGNSGSPLLDRAGDLVGVVYATADSSGDGLAMPLPTLRAFLAGRPLTGPLPCTE
jgi:S1-C subfamily serine protease